MINKNRFKIFNTGLAWKLIYNRNEIGSYRTKKAAEIDRDFMVSRYGI